jgi:hypothetical protein
MLYPDGHKTHSPYIKTYGDEHAVVVVCGLENEGTQVVIPPITSCVYVVPSVWGGGQERGEVGLTAEDMGQHQSFAPDSYPDGQGKDVVCEVEVEDTGQQFPSALNS